MNKFVATSRLKIIGLAVLLSVGFAWTADAHVELLSPDGGETLQVGNVFEISWQITIAHSLDNWDLYYSTTGDSGPWIVIEENIFGGDPGGGSIHTYDWTVPNNESSQVRVRIIMDNVAADYTSISASDLTIQNGPKEQIFSFLIDDQQANACAGTGSSARGFGVAVLSADSTSLSIYAEHDVSSVTSAHLHLAPACSNGGIAFGLASATSPISETWLLSPGDITNLLAGDLYLNIHSASFPAGEIRGQLVQEPIKFIFTLDEAQADEGNGTGSFNCGVGVGVLNALSTEFSFTITHDIPVDSAGDGHIHLGAPGVDGAIKFGFSSFGSPIEELWMVDTTNIKNLLAGNLYANVHTFANPNDEIRGQILRDSFRWAFLLDGSEANGGIGTGSSGGGFCLLELNADQDELSIYCEHDITSIGGEISLGVIGQSGPVQFSFASGTSPISQTWLVAADDVTRLLSDSLYIDIRSATFPGGEIRGQIDQGPYTVAFVLDESEADACAGTASLATGTGVVTIKPGGKEMTLSLTHTVSSPTSANINLGLPCISGPLQHSLSGAVNPVKDIWYLGSSRVQDILSGDLYLNITSTNFPGGEIRGQIAVPVSCCDLAGDVNDDSAVDIGDLTFTVDFMFRGGPSPSCDDDADVNADCSNDISDLTYRVDFMFRGGPALICGCAE